MALPNQLVIFGASGDLTLRKLLPALLRNHAEGALAAPLQVVGVSRSAKSSAAWRVEAERSMPAELAHAWPAFAPSLHWVQADASQPAEVAGLARRLDALLHEAGGRPEASGRLFYLALAPKLFGPVVAALSAEGLLTCAPDAPGWRRVIVEKPFGTDLASARQLNQELLTHLREDQIFRIDHYLGKETVQNILSLRFQNAIFEPLWNRNHIESVEISVCETVGMEGKRGAYYDQAGAMRDMIQNHVLQVLTLIAMEAPGSLDPDAVRTEKVKVLHALRPFTAERALTDTVRARYTAGPGQALDYLHEHGVAADSMTETYVAIRALVDNWRWSGVPFLLRTGKAMHKRYTSVVLRFRTPPLDLVSGPVPDGACPLRPNDLHLLIQPQEGLRLGFLVKQPGSGFTMRSANLGFDYADLGEGDTPPAYQRLLLDALTGQATLFLRGDEVEAAWHFVDGIRAGWQEGQAPMRSYVAGSTGPEDADDLFRGCEGVWDTGP